MRNFNRCFFIVVMVSPFYSSFDQKVNEIENYPGAKTEDVRSHFPLHGMTLQIYYFFGFTIFFTGFFYEEYCLLENL